MVLVTRVLLEGLGVLGRVGEADTPGSCIFGLLKPTTYALGLGTYSLGGGWEVQKGIRGIVGMTMSQDTDGTRSVSQNGLRSGGPSASGIHQGWGNNHPAQQLQVSLGL